MFPKFIAKGKKKKKKKPNFRFSTGDKSVWLTYPFDSLIRLTHLSVWLTLSIKVP